MLYDKVNVHKPQSDFIAIYLYNEILTKSETEWDITSKNMYESLKKWILNRSHQKIGKFYSLCTKFRNKILVRYINKVAKLKTKIKKIITQNLQNSYLWIDTMRDHYRKLFI